MRSTYRSSSSTPAERKTSTGYIHVDPRSDSSSRSVSGSTIGQRVPGSSALASALLSLDKSGSHADDSIAEVQPIEDDHTDEDGLEREAPELKVSAVILAMSSGLHV